MLTHALMFRLLSLPIIIGCLSGCGASQSSNGDGKVTLRYWQEIHRDKDPSDLQAASTAWELSQDSSQAQLVRMSAVIEVVLDTLKKQNDRIAGLTMKGVDPVLLDYSAKLAASNAAKMGTLVETKALIDQFQELTDPSHLAIDFLGSLLRHMEENEPLSAMFQEQFHEKARTIGQAIPQATQLEARMGALGKLQSEFQAAEISVRAALYKHHGVEFPPPSKCTEKPTGTSEAERIFTRRRLVLDAMGQKVNSWTFDALSEIQTFEITKRTIQGDKAQVQINSKVIGKNSGNKWDLDFFMNYARRGDSWHLVDLIPKS